VRVLAAPHHEEFALNVFGALEGVVGQAFAEATFVDVGGVEAGGGEDVGMEGGAEGEMAPDADAEGSEFAGTVGAGGEMVEDGAGISVVAGELFSGIPLVPAVGTGLVIGEDGSRGLELVVDLGHGDDVSVAREHGRSAADGGGDLEDFGVKDDAGVATGSGGTDDVGSHGAVRSGELYCFLVDNDHAE